MPRQRVLWCVISPALTTALTPKTSASYTDSHSRTVSSQLPDASRRPSQLQPTEWTLAEWAGYSFGFVEHLRKWAKDARVRVSVCTRCVCVRLRVRLRTFTFKRVC